MGPVNFVNERAFSVPGNLVKFLIAIANGWNAVYSDYSRTIPIIARSIDDQRSFAIVTRYMDAQRRYLRPFGTKFGELDVTRMKTLQGEMLNNASSENVSQLRHIDGGPPYVVE